VQPLEPPRQERQLVLSKHMGLLIWHRHQSGKREHPGGWVSVSVDAKCALSANHTASRKAGFARAE
jgi:hypothetical protein